jgi:bifunctional UDP-N-acetylglucosamine pyrophosphorylase / glucosamine-1-phosphate N-acetyltransferase
MSFESIVLAAGKGTRMKSNVSKVLHDIAGRKIVYFPVRAALESGASRVIVVCSEENREALQAYLVVAFGGERIVCVIQPQLRGTGDAARVGIEECRAENVLILCADTPLVQGSDLKPLISAAHAPTWTLSVLSCRLEDPTGYGRILRDGGGQVKSIVEHRDATATERAVAEVNSGIYFGQTAAIRQALASILPNNDQNEYYLTDIVAAIGQARRVDAHLGSADTLLGINDRQQLEIAEQRMLERIRARLRLRGVTIRGDARIDDGVELEADCIIEPGVQLRGSCRVGQGTHIDVGSVLSNATVGRNTKILPYTLITDSTVGDEAQIGPFSHLRPASVIEDQAHIGNFVETKKTRVRRGAKANHLSYLGDGDVGEKANIGAGTIFCNYDGYRKHPTTIGQGAFIGSDSQLVAPVVIGKGAYVGTGTTVTQDVPDDAMAIGRVRQENKPGYAAKLRARLAEQAGKKP